MKARPELDHPRQSEQCRKWTARWVHPPEEGWDEKAGRRLRPFLERSFRAGCGCLTYLLAPRVLGCRVCSASRWEHGVGCASSCFLVQMRSACEIGGLPWKP